MSAEEAVEIVEVSPEIDAAIRQLIVWRSLGHADGCLCHMCIPLRALLTGVLDLVDYYYPRYGGPSALLAGICHHGVLTTIDCEQCEGAWLSGSGKPSQPSPSIDCSAPVLPKKE